MMRIWLKLRSTASAGSSGPERLHPWVQVHAPDPLAGRVLVETLDELADDGLRWDQNPELVGLEAPVGIRLERRPLERVLAQVHHKRDVRRCPLAGEKMAFNPGEVDLPMVVPQRIEVTVVIAEEDFTAWAFRDFPLEERHEVVAVQMGLEGLRACRHSP